MVPDEGQDEARLRGPLRDEDQGNWPHPGARFEDDAQGRTPGAGPQPVGPDEVQPKEDTANPQVSMLVIGGVERDLSGGKKPELVREAERY